MTKNKWDGKSRPSNNVYRKNWNDIFNTNPVAKEVRTPKFKSQVITSKKTYDRKNIITEEQDD
jgi:hypothetical protein